MGCGCRSEQVASTVGVDVRARSWWCTELSSWLASTVREWSTWVASPSTSCRRGPRCRRTPERATVRVSTLVSVAADWLLLSWCSAVGGDDHAAAGATGRTATVAAVAADTDEAAAAMATVAAGRTAAAGVDVADLGVLAAAGVGGDVATAWVLTSWLLSRCRCRCRRPGRWSPARRGRRRCWRRRCRRRRRCRHP